MKQIKIIISTIFQILFMMTVSSCGESEFEFSSAPCNLLIDNSLHHDATLASALSQYSGTYVTITTTTKSGVRYFSFVSNNGTKSQSIFNAYDTRRAESGTMIIGKNGAVIVGYGNSVDGILYAYDRECPNCFDVNVLPMKSRPLTISENGIAKCGRCKREYNLNNGGIITSGDKGNKLTRYRCTATGAYGILNVN